MLRIIAGTPSRRIIARQPLMPNNCACAISQVETGAPSVPVSGIAVTKSDIIQTRLRDGMKLTHDWIAGEIASGAEGK